MKKEVLHYRSYDGKIACGIKSKDAKRIAVNRWTTTCKNCRKVIYAK